MDPIGLDSRAADWIKRWKAPVGSSQGAQYEHALDVYDLLYKDPETLWLLILEIHHQDQSPRTQQVLSAGPLEDLLAMHGDNFIDRCETEARRDPQFAKLLGGIWQNSMSEAVWTRLQGVWDRRGWDGVPE